MPTTPSASKGSRNRGQSSRRFTEVVSLGPTSIPDNNQVVAALSDARAGEASASRDLLRGRYPDDDPLAHQASLQVTGVNDRRAVRSLEAPATRRAADTPARGTGDAPASGSGNPERIDVAEESVEAPGGGLLEWALTPVRSVIDAVKWAGASVNDVAVAPVMRLASPSALAGSLLTTLKAYTPQRARDLARVVGNVLVNFAGLARTPAGLELLGSAGRAAGSLSKAVSSPAGRQFAVDYASGLVKMAEALNTPEVKAAIQQGAVVMARGMDLLADSRSKFFLQDTANVLVRSIELANSKEATVLVAELTANIVHALEMEQITGATGVGQGADPGDILDGDVRISGGEAEVKPSGSPVVGEASALDANATQDPGAVSVNLPKADGAFGHDSAHDGRHRGDAGYREADTPPVQPIPSPVRGSEVDDPFQMDDFPTHDSRTPVGADGGSEVDDPFQMDDFPKHDSRTPVGADGEATRFQASTGTSGEEETLASRRAAAHAVEDRTTDGGFAGRATDGVARGGNRQKRLDEIRVIATPITQADLNANTRLRITRVHVPHDDGVGRRISSEASRSAPSSPTGRRDSIRAAAIAASGPPADAGAEDGLHRPRAYSTTGFECGAPDPGVPAGSASTHVNTDDVEEHAGEPVELRDGPGDDLFAGEDDSPRTPARYARDGHHFLPRFTGESFASLLRRPPEGLEHLLEPPTRATFERALSRATRRSQDRAALGRRRGETNDALDSSETPRAAHASWKSEYPRSIGSLGDGEFAGSSDDVVGGRGTGWLQLCFAVMFIGFALDGLVHRTVGLIWRHDVKEPSSGFNNELSSRHASFTGLDLNSAGRSDGGLERRWHSSFLPPSCRDPVSGGIMIVWVTPAGPCVAPGENIEVMAGNMGNEMLGAWSSRPTCARSFRMCSTAEISGGEGPDTGPSFDDGVGDGGGECIGSEHLDQVSCRGTEGDGPSGA